MGWGGLGRESKYYWRQILSLFIRLFSAIQMYMTVTSLPESPAKKVGRWGKPELVLTVDVGNRSLTAETQMAVSQTRSLARDWMT